MRICIIIYNSRLKFLNSYKWSLKKITKLIIGEKYKNL